MSEVKKYTRYFKAFKRAINNLKGSYYSTFSYSNGRPSQGRAGDSSLSGDIASSYILKASKKFVHKNRNKIMHQAAEMMEEDRNYSKDKKKKE